HSGGLDDLNPYRKAYKNWKLPFYCHKDALNYLKYKKDLDYLFSSILEEKIVEPNESFNVGELKITSFKTNHGSFAPGSVGYILDEKNKRLVYTSDFSSINDESKITEKKIDTLIIEANWFNEPLTNKPGHMSFQKAMDYIKKWNPENVYFIHFSDETPEPINPLPYEIPKNYNEWDKTARKAFKDNGLGKYCEQENIISYDGLEIIL
ncbi:MAG: MBL fold metallo-hydrolase, partial [Candidatus Nanoarchaeia archaeon]|nr:MBL fold metallo-hydrolase [Candidatus Nanoarchaeia archaeon]